MSIKMNQLCSRLASKAVIISCCLNVHFSIAQTYNIATSNGQTITTCSGTFTDSGGSGGNYSPSENYTITFYSGNACTPVSVNFTQFDIENGWDELKVYDGPNTSSPAIPFSNTITSKSNYLTFRFTSDGSVQYSGWTATISCPPLTYTAGCKTALPSFSTTAGNFSFSVPPGDGATIDNATGIISNGTEGATYHVQDACSGRNTSFTMGTPPCYRMNGNSTIINTGGNNCIQLTAASNDQIGCAWNDQPVDFNSDFSLSLDYYFGNNPGGADGTTFTFQPNPAASCGGGGAQLGAGGIPNALIIEFDTYDNDGSSGNDLSCDHIAVETDGVLVHDPANGANSPPYCGPICANSSGGSIETGTTHHIEITWNSQTNTLKVFFNGNERLSCNGNFVSTVFGGHSQVYWGATGATGGLNNQQYFCPQTVVVLGASLRMFDVFCVDNELSAVWESEKEENLDYFELQHTYDGFVYYTSERIKAKGAHDAYRYVLPVNDPNAGNAYFRIKMVDYNGDVVYSELTVPKNCKPSDQVIASYFDSQLYIVSKSMKDFHYQLLDTNGKIVAKGNSSQGKVSEAIHLAKGVYFTTVQYTDGNSINQKIIAH